MVGSRGVSREPFRSHNETACVPRPFAGTSTRTVLQGVEQQVSRRAGGDLGAPQCSYLSSTASQPGGPPRRTSHCHHVAVAPPDVGGHLRRRISGRSMSAWSHLSRGGVTATLGYGGFGDDRTENLPTNPWVAT